MREVCDFHLNNPDQTAITDTCEECNTCNVCGKVYFNQNEDDEKGLEYWECPYCNEAEGKK